MEDFVGERMVENICAISVTGSEWPQLILPIREDFSLLALVKARLVGLAVCLLTAEGPWGSLRVPEDPVRLVVVFVSMGGSFWLPAAANTVTAEAIRWLNMNWSFVKSTIR